MCCNKITKYLPLNDKQTIYVMWEDVKYDISYLKKISNNDEDFIQEMVETFVTLTPEYFNDIENCYAEKKFDNLYKAVHKFIPTLAFVSAKEYIDKFEKLEKLALEKQDDEELHNLIPALKNYCYYLIEQLKKDFKL